MLLATIRCAGHPILLLCASHPEFGDFVGCKEWKRLWAAMACGGQGVIFANDMADDSARPPMLAPCLQNGVGMLWRAGCQ